ncbi:hypothetical protein GCM10018775_46260 [Streptomyces umbrinus]|nr:hypothetical protein GCM10018775_46260 [Streptomyces umbrinus]
MRAGWLCLSAQFPAPLNRGAGNCAIFWPLRRLRSGGSGAEPLSQGREWVGAAGAKKLPAPPAPTHPAPAAAQVEDPMACREGEEKDWLRTIRTDGQN